MSRESRALAIFRNKWVGKRILCRGVPSIMGDGPRDVVGTVDGVCDDGARCDGDHRRRYKPTGQLIVISDTGVTEYLPSDRCETPCSKEAKA